MSALIIECVADQGGLSLAYIPNVPQAAPVDRGGIFIIYFA